MRPLDPRLVRRSRPVRRLLVAGVLVASTAALVTVAQAWLLADVVATLAAGEAVVTTTAVLAGVVAARGVLAWVQSTLAGRAATAVQADLRHDLVDAVLDPRHTGVQPRSARVAALLDDGIDRLEGYVARFLPQLVVTVVVPAVVVVALATVDLLAAVIVVLTLPLVVAFLVLVGLVTRDRLDRRWDELQRLGRHFSDVLEGIVVLKGLGRRQERGLRAVGERHRRATTESLRTAFLSSLVLELFSTLSVAIVAVATGLRMVGGGLDLRTGLFLIVLAPEAYLPLRRLGAHFHDSTQGVAVAAEVLDLLEEQGARSGTLPPPASGDLVVEGLEVSYPGRGEPALVLDAAVVRPGEVVAVTGPSGGGKSTLLGVLLGFVAPTSGRVLVGGVDLAELDVERWRETVAWVPQVPGLLSGTVAENVRLGAPGADDDAVRAALHDAGAGDIAPGRELAEGAKDLSAGERRRVGIARALLRVRVGGARLLLMDEPTAGLDAAREAAVLDVVRGLGVTVLLVAHRPESIAATDRVLTLGRVPEVVR